jgi:hypothetical protein
VLALLSFPKDELLGLLLRGAALIITIGAAGELSVSRNYQALRNLSTFGRTVRVF